MHFHFSEAHTGWNYCFRVNVSLNKNASAHNHVYKSKGTKMARCCFVFSFQEHPVERRHWQFVRAKQIGGSLSTRRRRQWHPLQYSCLENPMDGGAWKAAVHGVAEGQTRLNDFTFTFHFHSLEKEMATRSSVLAWRIPETEEPGGLPSMGSHRVRHEWSNLAAAAAVYPLMSNSIISFH